MDDATVSLHRRTFPVGPLACNCSILTCAATREAVVVDPGDEAERIQRELAAAAVKVVAIVHTHAHIDHVGATAAIARHTAAPTYLHPDDALLHRMLPVQAQLLGLPVPESCPMDHPLTDGGTLTFGKHRLGILHTPGHTPGSVSLVVEGKELCLSGDTLFAGGIGRTDLWGGDAAAIARSIRHRLYALHGDVEVIPGHGGTTTIDRERRSNPYVRGP